MPNAFIHSIQTLATVEDAVKLHPETAKRTNLVTLNRYIPFTSREQLRLISSRSKQKSQEFDI